MVFVNILGVQGLVEQAGVHVALAQLQTYGRLLATLAERHRGFIVSTDIATEGTKVLLAFGAPFAHEYAAANAARFAGDLTAAVREARLDLDQRVGVNGGHVFAGEVGPQSRRQYTVMGDATNLAARLMGAAAPGQALISRDTLQRAGPGLCALELAPLAVKGKERPVAVCALAGEAAPGGDMGPGPLPAAGARLFGRSTELALLRRLAQEAGSGQGSTVLVEGEAGVGKTRLVDETLAGLGESLTVLRAACFEHLQAAPFTPWADVLQRVFEISPDDSVETRDSRVRALLDDRLPRSAEFASLLSPLLGLSLPQGEVVRSLDAQSRRERLFGLVTDVLGSAAQERPLVLVLEDLHWVDDSSQALVEHLAAEVGGLPLLVVLTARPTETLSGLYGRGVQRVLLDELSEAESLAMVREALGRHDLPVEVGTAVYQKTKGNPLFLEEVVRSLQAPAVLERILGASSVARAAELAALELPDRVQGLLMARIDGLAPDTREVLKAGSVVGRTFDVEVLRGIDDPQLREVALGTSFDELVSSTLVLATDGGREGRLTFRHALVQEVAYESLPFARRRDLHARVARHLEAVSETPDHGLLLHHYRHAGNVARTRLHALRAAESALAAYASLEAVDYLGVALETSSRRTAHDAALRSRIEELMGDGLAILARHEEAIDCFVRARRRWASPTVRAAAGPALDGLSPIDEPFARESLLCWKIAVSLDRGLSAYRRALRWLALGARALPSESGALAARISVAECAFLFQLGRFQDAVCLGEEGVALARRHGEAGLQAYALTTLAGACSGLGLLEQAVAYDLEAVALYEEAGELAGLAMSHLNLANSYFLSGDLRPALEHEERALGLYARIGDIGGVALQHLNLGGVLLQMGQVEEAIAHLEESLRLRAGPGVSPQVAGFTLVLLCKALVWAGRLEAAGEALDESVAILERLDTQGNLLDACVIQGELRLAEGRLDEAEASCRRALDDARELGAEVNEAQALCMLARVRLARGEPQDVFEDLRRSVAVAERIGAAYERAQALAALAEAEAACAEPRAGCDDLLHEAIHEFERMDAGYDLRKARELRERLGAPAASR